MKVLRKAKENLFILFIAAAYIAMFIINQNMGIASVKNSFYYIKEMIMIMPVIFVLTALLDLWVPKEKIMKYLGKEAKTKGVVLSLALGSISAGPIYAAFPLCVMLHKKGASVRNLVIILSAWAVIKVPMLLNELKFLGFKFMAVRWVLTVIGIVVFSWITAKIVRMMTCLSSGQIRAALLSTDPPAWGVLCVQKTTRSYLKFRTKKLLSKKLAKRSIRRSL
jgi:uncharacterized membrane protein YraQ (UPF0718 family)